MGAEEVAFTGIAAKTHEFRRTPAVTAHDGLLEAQLLGLFHNEGHFVIILGGEEHIGPGCDDFGELGAEVLVLGGKSLEGHHRAGAMDLFKGLLEILGQALGVVAGNVIQHGRLLGLELLGHELGSHRPLERIQEAGPKHIGTIFRGLGIGRPGGNHGSLVGIADLTRGDGLLAGIGTDDGNHLILGDQLQGRRGRRLSLGFVVFVDKVNFESLVSHLDPAGSVGLFLEHLGGEFGTLPHLRDIPGELDVEAHLEDLSMAQRNTCHEQHGTENCWNYPETPPHKTPPLF